MVWLFNWNLVSSTFTWCYLYLSILQFEIWDWSWISNSSRLRLCYYVIAFANFLASLLFYFIAQIACGGWSVVSNLCLFQNAIARNNLKTVCDSVNDKVPVIISFKVSYPGLLVSGGCDCRGVNWESHRGGCVMFIVGVSPVTVWYQTNMLTNWRQIGVV